MSATEEQAFTEFVDKTSEKQFRATPDALDLESDMIENSTAKRSVNVELIGKIGQAIYTGKPQLYRNGNDEAYWRVPLLVVPPEGNPEDYPLGLYADVDAYSGTYTLDLGTIKKIKEKAISILKNL